MAEPAMVTPIATVYGEPVLEVPRDLYIPPDALEVFLEQFQGPLDLLLYLIRKENINVLDIPMARLTAQYLEYVEAMRSRSLEMAAEYLLMAALLIEIDVSVKSVNVLTAIGISNDSGPFQGEA